MFVREGKLVVVLADVEHLWLGVWSGVVALVLPAYVPQADTGRMATTDRPASRDARLHSMKVFPGMHSPEKSDGGREQLALEQLAAFSLLARWVDRAEVEKA